MPAPPIPTRRRQSASATTGSVIPIDVHAPLLWELGKRLVGKPKAASVESVENANDSDAGSVVKFAERLFRSVEI
jgi:hypothetical protein